MIKHFRYSSATQPFINVRGVNIYPKPDYLLSEVSLFGSETDFIEGLVVEYKETEEDAYVQTFPIVDQPIAPAKPTKVPKAEQVKPDAIPDQVVESVKLFKNEEEVAQ